MSLVGSVRVANAGRKAVQTVYLRSGQKHVSEETKITDTKPFIKPSPSDNLVFDKTSPVWRDIPRGFVPFM